MRPRDLGLLMGLALIAFLAGLGNRGITGAHEARVVFTAQTMLASGPPWQAEAVLAQHAAEPAASPEELGVRDAVAPSSSDSAADSTGQSRVNPWVVPVYKQQVRLQKPPLPYWAAAGAMALLGQSELAARLIPGLMGAAAALLVAFLAGELLGRRAAVPAALAWVSIHFVAEEFRQATTDPFLAFFCLAALSAWVRSTRADGPTLAADRPRSARVCCLLLAYGLLALACLSKGPVALVQVFLPAALLIYTHRRRPRLGVGWHIVGVALLLAICLPWPLAVLRTAPEAARLWVVESVGKFSPAVHHPRPWWYYLPIALQVALPWTPLALLAGAFLIRLRAWDCPVRRQRLFPLLWFALIVAFFSLAQMKKAAYLLPAMPAAAMLIAQGFHVLRLLARQRFHYAWRIQQAYAAVGIGAAAVLAVLHTIDASTPTGQPGATLATIGAWRSVVAPLEVVLAAAVMSAGFLPWRWCNASHLQPRRWLRSQACVYSLLICLILTLPREGDQPLSQAPASPSAAQQDDGPPSQWLVPTASRPRLKTLGGVEDDVVVAGDDDVGDLDRFQQAFLGFLRVETAAQHPAVLQVLDRRDRVAGHENGHGWIAQ